MKNIVYVSDISAQFHPDALSDILEVARRENVKNDITGLLLYGSGHFIQSIEGPEANIDALIKSIEADPRHRNLKVIAERSVEERLFPNWWMGLLNMEEKILLSKRYNEVISEMSDENLNKNFKDSVLALFQEFCSVNNLSLSEPPVPMSQKAEHNSANNS